MIFYAHFGRYLHSPLFDKMKTRLYVARKINGKIRFFQSFLN